jgi:preprotein translocase subunit SecA
MLGFITKIFGTKNEREIKRVIPLVDEINSLEPEISPLTDAQLAGKGDELRRTLEQGQSLDDILPHAFAVVREVSRRTLKLRHFDVQLIGGIVLHQGKIAEMKTGEGKTLMATLAVFLNALEGKGVHVITVNDYLAKRDTQWMGPIYNFLGFSVGVIQHDESFLYDPSYHNEITSLQNLRPVSRQQAYHADITYGTNNEFGFDYLRDNMRYDIQEFVQRDLHYAIVDEVDSILIDEARTPLIISGPAEESTDKYYKIDKIIPRIPKEEYTIDEKTKSVTFTEEGNARIEKLLEREGILESGNLYDPANIELVHHVNQALRAHTLFKRDVDYLVKDGEVIIVDEFTGRLMPGRRWSDGLHQAIEAKEGVRIASENQTLATVTFQNYFRMYNKLAGMTGTADTEAAEFGKIYNLDVVVIPTHKPMIRVDHHDAIYKTAQGKFNAVVEEIADCHKRGQPVLVGTISIEMSEHLNTLLTKRGISHSVLNAKHHENEAEIIAQAGRSSSVTIATNMAGRGTDIVLGGNPEGLAKMKMKENKAHTEDDYKKFEKEFRNICEEDKKKVLSAGGLHILGTERHESRRIDNQLRGRSGRQGDPGSSRFYLSLEDDLMRIFGSERISGLMGKLGMDDSVPIEHRMISRAVENAQKKVEAHNFDIRKHLLEYDDVMNQQRSEIYSFRKNTLEGTDIKEKILDMIEDTIEDLLIDYCPEGRYGEWDIGGLKNALFRQFSISVDLEDEISDSDTLRDKVEHEIKEYYRSKEEEFGEETLRTLERYELLKVLDTQWKDHLLSMDRLKEGIGLRGYGQRDPIVEYKKEAFEIFADLSDRVASETIKRLFSFQVLKGDNLEKLLSAKAANPVKFQYNTDERSSKGKTVVKGKKVGRNAPCPCGSGKKYKKCCGAKAA